MRSSQKLGAQMAGDDRSSTPRRTDPRQGGPAFRLVLIFLAVLTAVRLLTLFNAKLELYPDEAQYWVWSRRLALGYFSKPPMIAWLIAATTAISGQSEPWVRLSAPILHSLTALLLACIGRRLYSPLTGAVAAVIYILSPGVDLSSAIIATDAPLMACLSLTLLAYAVWWTTQSAVHRRFAAAAFGLALGLACLAKYAALYFAFSALLHPFLCRQTRARWSGLEVCLALGCFLAAFSPNLYWNATHHFQTVAHTAADADLGEDAQPHRWFDPRGGIGFILGQLGIFGPVPFAGLIIGVVMFWRKHTATATDRLLMTFAAPPLAFVLIEAVISRANANWAGAAYGPCALLSAAIFVRWRAWRTLATGLGLQAVGAAAFMIFLVMPGIGGSLFANSVKRARGWEATTQAIERAGTQAGRPLTAILVDDRFLFNALSYYGRDALGRPAARLAAPLRTWIRFNHPRNQAEADASLTAAEGSRILVVSANPKYQPEIRADFLSSDRAARTETITLDPKHRRVVTLFIANTYQRRPRVSKRPRGSVPAR